MSFAHLETHSHYSLLRAAPSIPQLVTQAVADGLESLCLTDEVALHGAVAFERACRAAGIHPVIGLTVPVAGSPQMRAGGAAQGETSPGKLVLLADGPEGYRALCRLTSLLQAGPDRETLMARGLDWETLATHAGGVYALSGGRAGWIERLLRAGDRGRAAEMAARFAGIYQSRARLALEIHDPADLAIAEAVAEIGRRFGIECVAVQPIYCLSPDDAETLRLLAAIRGNIPLHGLARRCRHIGASSLAHAIRDAGTLCALPAGHRSDGRVARARAGRGCPMAAWCGPISIWRETARRMRRCAGWQFAGLIERYGPQADAAVARRLERELAAILAHGYAPLFLVVADVVHHSRREGIPVSTRGSVANSLVAYCAGITTVDPIAHDLLFERFLNPARSDIPDIDLDFCSRRRDEVLEYVRERYGSEHVAIIGTISTMQLQSAIRETGKAYELPGDEINRLAALAPRQWHPDPRRRDRRTMEDVLATIEDPVQRQVVRSAYGLVGQPDHLSLHPGGVVITPGPLTDYAPIQMSPKGFFVTQYEHGDIEQLGLPKIDLLGIRALTVMADTATLVRRYHDPDFRLEDIPLDDDLTGRTAGPGRHRRACFSASRKGRKPRCENSARTVCATSRWRTPSSSRGRRPAAWPARSCVVIAARNRCAISIQAWRRSWGRPAACCCSRSRSCAWPRRSPA